MTLDEVKLITELLPDAFILLSESGSILTANPAAHELFRTDHLVGLALADLITDPPSKVSDWLKPLELQPENDRQFIQLAVRRHRCSSSL